MSRGDACLGPRHQKMYDSMMYFRTWLADADT